MLFFKAFTRKAFNYVGKAPGHSSVNGVGAYSLQDFWASLGSSHGSGCPPTYLLSISERSQLLTGAGGDRGQPLARVTCAGHPGGKPGAVRMGAVRGLFQQADGLSLPLGLRVTAGLP